MPNQERHSEIDFRGKAAAWRRRAEDLRAIAAHVKDPEIKADLVKQARQWDRMAEEADALACLQDARRSRDDSGDTGAHRSG